MARASVVVLRYVRAHPALCPARSSSISDLRCLRQPRASPPILPHTSRRPHHGGAAAGSHPAIAGGIQLDSSVGAGFWLYRVCMYVYENSGRMFGRGILAGGSLRDFDGVHLEYRKIF
jgi:hypothetical protein